MNVRRTLSRLPAPDETGAQERAWAVVREAYRAQPSAPPRRSRIRLAIALGVAALAVALMLSPAGASVRRAISHALRDSPRARNPQALHITGLTLPAAGALLLSGPAGTWTVAADGSKHFIGRWPQASWSPRRRNLAVAGGGELAALTPSGRPEWILWRRDAHDPTWYAPTGYRVAYRSGSELRVTIGNGTGDHLLAAGVQPVAPAWRTGHPYQLAYSPGPGVVAVREADTGRLLWSARAPGPVRELQWSGDGRELLALTASAVRLYDGAGRKLATLDPGPLAAAALSPDGRKLALLRGRPAQDVVLVTLSSGARARRRLIAAAGLTDVLFSPDGRWLLLDWPVADEWLFARVSGSPQILGLGELSRRIGARGKPLALEGWCCTVSGGATR